MLSKTKTDIILKENVLYTNDGNYAPATNTDTTIASYTLTTTGSVSVHFTASMDTGGSVKLYKGTTAIKTISTTGTYDYVVDFASWDTTKITAKCSSGASYVTWVQNIKYSIKEYEINPANNVTIPLKAYDVANIWEYIYTHLYGINDKTYTGGIMLEKSSTATTWNITPSNFKGYIKVAFNGEYIKIPYYSD